MNNVSDLSSSEERHAIFHFRLSLAYLALFVVGCVGNLLTLLSIFMVKQLKTTPNMYVANLAAMDLLICTSMAVSPAYFVVTGYRFAYCRVFGFIAVYCIASSRLHLCCIAINR